MPAATAAWTVATHSSKVVSPHTIPSPPPPRVRLDTGESLPNLCCCISATLRSQLPPQPENNSPTALAIRAFDSITGSPIAAKRLRWRSVKPMQSSSRYSPPGLASAAPACARIPRSSAYGLALPKIGGRPGLRHLPLSECSCAASGTMTPSRGAAAIPQPSAG